jgi:hypothetical protein
MAASLARPDFFQQNVVRTVDDFVSVSSGR